MESDYVEYKGCRIAPKPASDPGGRWYGGYAIWTRDGSLVSTRTYIFPGFLYFDAAWHDSVEYAKVEIDNLILAGLICVNV